MAQNSEINNKFGMYKSLCCEWEIVIAEGATFPDCPRHVKLTTEWKLVAELPDGVLHLSEIKNENRTWQHAQPSDHRYLPFRR